MRWGIQTESVNNHGEVSTCLKEIQLCKKYSVATNFVVNRQKKQNEPNENLLAFSLDLLIEPKGSSESSLRVSADSSKDFTKTLRMFTFNVYRRRTRRKTTARPMVQNR